MQAKKRYLLVIGTALAACLIVLFFSRADSEENTRQNVHTREILRPRSYVDDNDVVSESDLHVSARQRRDPSSTPGFLPRKSCLMETCFDFSLCKHGFTVYVYPIQERVSEKYKEILTSIKASRYYTPDPKKACLFILSIDTLDRDTLSTEFVKNVQQKVEKLEYWRNGLNHIIFNIYSGTWPDYDENDLGFDVGKAMLAKASISHVNYRPGFDISLPLFHKEHAAKGGERGTLQGNNVPPQQKYTLVFKGKRYLAGIGSETRNSLYHIHNDMDIIMLTTCKHGRDWKRMSDERCEHDNREYDRYDYKTLLNNSTFCLVPRGRRLGSFRFLEALKAACIPVLLSNGWVLPFSEVIDWNRAAIWGDERLLLQIPSIVRSVSHSEILWLRQQTQFLWDAYFSSMENMINTMLEILKDRVTVGLLKSGFVWNTIPGAVTTLPEFSDNLADFPFFLDQLGVVPSLRYTAVIYATSPTVIYSATFSKLMKNLAKSKRLDMVLILVHSDTTPAMDHRWPLSRRVPVIFKQIKSLSDRFYPHSEITTDAVLSLDDDALLTADEMDFAFSVWRNFPDRIVGYPARNHFWDEGKARWGYTSKWTNEYSMVLTGAAFYHRYYAHLYSTYLQEDLRQLVDTSNNCEDILFNFMVSHVTKHPPIKVGQRRHYKEVPPSSVEHFNQRQMCMDIFVNSMGAMPLLRSSLRLDPVLFKDPVSISRKKYRQMELV